MDNNNRNNPDYRKQVQAMVDAAELRLDTRAAVIEAEEGVIVASPGVTPTQRLLALYANRSADKKQP